MSAIFIQVGQCGNQLGEAIFERVHNEVSDISDRSFSETCFKRFFSTTTQESEPIANAVLVDMEKKVIDKCLSKSNRWYYNPRACVVAKQGSGNNWANGYCNFGTEMEEQIADAVKVISNQIANLSTVIILMSSAGGTGSGLGCKITEIIRDILPGALILNQVVLPFSQGEVSVQGYNILLSLSALYQNSDSITLSQNDQYQGLCRRLLPNNGKDCISFNEINSLMSSHLAGILLPSSIIKEEEEPVQIEIDQVIEHLVPHPAYKLLSCRMMPVVSEHSREFTNTTWDMLSKYSRQMLFQNSIKDEGLLWNIRPASETGTCNRQTSINRSISNFVVCRGSKTLLPQIEDRYSVVDMYRGDRTKVMFGYCKHDFGKLDKSVFVMSNAAQNGAFLEKLLVDSWRKFNAKAFLYQYENFGLGSDWFLDSFNIMEKVNLDYRAISS